MKGITITILQVKKAMVSAVTTLRQKLLAFHLLFENVRQPLLPNYLSLQLEVENHISIKMKMFSGQGNKMG